MYIYTYTQGIKVGFKFFCIVFHFTLTDFSHVFPKEFNSNSSVFCIKQSL